jgi:hypothetical protein
MASIALNNKRLGTVTNEDGIFELYLPVSSGADTITISSLSYASKKIVVSSVADEPLMILLEEKPLLLNEVTISSERLTANTIFSKAFESLDKNFPQEPFLLKGFFRQLSSENGKYVLLIESALEIYDKGHQLNTTFNLQEKVAIPQSRVSKNYFEHQQQNFFDYHNTLRQLLVWNYARYSNHYVMGRQNFVIDTVTYLHNKPVYVISSTESKYTGETLEGRNRFTLHIDCETFAIHQIKNETIAQPGYFLPARPGFIKGDKSKLLKWTTSSHTYSFREFEGKMYLSNATGLMKGQVINIDNNAVDREVADEELLMINEIKTDRVDVPSKNLMDKKKGINFQNTTYDENFWSDYSQVKLVPLTEKQEQDLEWEMKLEEQFKATGKQD